MIFQALIDRPANESSPWRDVLRKLGLLFRWAWPSGSVGLQISCLICLAILVAERIVNVFTPIVYKMISKAVLIIMLDRQLFICRSFLYYFSQCPESRWHRLKNGVLLDVDPGLLSSLVPPRFSSWSRQESFVAQSGTESCTEGPGTNTHHTSLVM